MVLGLNTLPGWPSKLMGTADDEMGSASPGWKWGWDTRPTCHSWLNMMPPWLCTASVTWRQPSTCAGSKMPGSEGRARGRHLGRVISCAVTS